MADHGHAQAGGVKRFRCRQPGCPYSFAKAGHRTRHELTHSGAKAFACPVCQRRFARNDARVRHVRLHDSDGSAPRHPQTTSEPLAPSSTDAEAPDTRHEDTADLFASSNLARTHEAAAFAAAPDAGATPPGPWNSFLDPDMDVFWDNAFTADGSFWDEWVRSMTPAMRNAPTGSTTPPAAACSDAQDQKSQCNGFGQASSERAIQRALSALNSSIRSLPSTRVVICQAPESEPRFLHGLRDCLDTFLSRFSNVLPVIHQPTFDVSETAPSTLLLMLALGSAFTGDDLAAARGDSLWSLAHAVAVTSWPAMLANRGVHDVSPGVQLILTATFGQSFALMSKSSQMRTAAQVVHSLGFHWARQGGMYSHDYSQRSYFDDATVPLISRWKKWAAGEVQLRALLAHYILDGQIAQCSNKSTCVRHCINPLPMPAGTAIFDAKDATGWESLRSGELGMTLSFREFILGLSSPSQPPFVRKPISTFAVRVILECFQSLASDRFEAGGDALGSPSQRESTIGMLRLYWSQIVQNDQEYDLALRWHSIFGFSMLSNIHEVGCQLCRSHGIEQDLLSAPEPSAPRPAPDIAFWTRTYGGRATLLHALCICDTLKKLPLAGVTAMHLPFTVFSAAATLLAFLHVGQSVVAVPAAVEWAGPEEGTTRLDHDGQSVVGLDTELFCQGIPIQRTTERKLRIELQGLRTHLRILGATWGICTPMETLLETLNQAI